MFGLVKNKKTRYNMVGKVKESAMIRDKIEETIQQYRLILPGERIGVAVSGGADSMVLLHVLENLALRLGFSLMVLHFEHGIRGAESLRDMEFVKEQCALRQLPLACLLYTSRAIEKTS